MSTRYNDGPHYENHQRAAELEDIAAHAHRTAEVSHEQQDHQTGQEHSRQALEHSQRAFEHSEATHRVTVNQHGLTTFGHAEIAALAHQLWLDRGSPEGSPDEDWYHATQKLRTRPVDLRQ